LSDSKLTELTADVVAAYVMHNTIPVADLPGFINSVHAALGGPAAPVAEAVDEPRKPTAAQIRKSITPDVLISFVDGRPYKTLRRHLTTHGLTVEQYKAQFGLPKDYPVVAPAYSAARSQMAKAIGLGQGGRGAAAKASGRKGRAGKTAG
jgi:predicted transcriptional regulator